jgi:UDP-glucose 4-epimerase
VEIKKRHVVVTGGAGFIGSHLVDSLLRRDNRVTVIDDFSIGKAAHLAQHRGDQRLTIERADVRDLTRMIELTRGADVVFHLACGCLRASLEDPVASHEINATGTLNMCEASRVNHVQRFIYTSTGEVYGNAVYLPIDEAHPFHPTQVYGAAKGAGELYAQAYWRCYGLPTVVLRFFNVYGPRACCEGARAEVIPKFILRTMAGLPPMIFGSGEQSRSFIWIEDLVQGILLAAECDALIGDRVQLGGPREVTIAALSQMVLEKLGRSDLQPIHLNDGRPGDIGRSQADISKARSVLGFTPLTDIDAGLDKYIAWIRTQDLDMEAWLQQERVRNWQTADTEEDKGSSGQVPAAVRPTIQGPAAALGPLVAKGIAMPTKYEAKE